MTDKPLPDKPLPVCSPDLLRTLFLFEKLSDDRLDWLCRSGAIERFEVGTVYAEGDDATCVYILLDGTLVLSRRVGDDDVDVTRTSQRGVYSGAMQSYLGDRVPQVYGNSMRVTETSDFFVMDAAILGQMMTEWFPMALHLLEGLFFGLRSSNETIGQRERLLALGSLSAGLTHELNNPASAAVRATGALRERVSAMRHKLAMIASGAYDRVDLEKLITFQEEAAEMVAKAPELSPLEASDREDALGDWMDERGLSQGWEVAPTFVQAGLDIDWLERVVSTVGPKAMDGAVRWLFYTIETELLMNEIQDSTERITELVKSAKQYSQLDRAPYQDADLHELLKSTLVMLKAKIGPDIKIVKDFDRSLPLVPAYAAELNQVWTNLIDNAVQAMDGSGTLTVRTARVDNRALVEICDTGPGVPDQIRDRIFEPFFTTKEVGQGTGLGLDISYRIVVNKHHGDLKLLSSPGDTRFQVLLPLVAPDEFAELRGASASADAIGVSSVR